MEIASVLSKYSVKEERVDDGNVNSSSLGENEDVKNEFGTMTHHKSGQIWNEAGQNIEESHSPDTKETVLEQSEVQFKLESISDQEVIKDEIDAPDFASLEDFNGKQEDTHKKNQLAPKRKDDGSTMKKYKCEKCAYQTNIWNYMTRHLEKHKQRSKRKLFDCPTCGRTYTAKQSLQNHMPVHMDPKDQPMYNCDVCDYKTIHKFTIKMHILRHSNQARNNRLSKRSEFDCMVELDRIQAVPKDGTGKLSRTDIKIENESVIDEYSVKEESDADNLQNYLGRNGNIKSEFEAEVYQKNESEQDVEESHNTDVKGNILDESDVKVKLESISDEEAIDDEIDKPDYVSLEEFNGKQEDLLDYETNQLAFNNASIDKRVVNTTVCETSHEDESKPEKYKCEKCTYQANDLRLLKRHVERHKGRKERKRIDCTTCGRTYFSKQSLEQHMLLHMDPEDRPMYDCDVCGYKTIYQSRIKEHKLRHANRAKSKTAESEKAQKSYRHKCKECSYQTNYSMHLKAHEQTHKARSDRELFECETCHRTCTTKSGLNQHRLLHMAPKDRPTYDCDECEFKTIYKERLKLHKVAHTNRPKSEVAESKRGTSDRVYKCNECSYETVNSGHFKRHQHTHKPRSDRVLFQCTHCDRTCTTRSHLKEHMLLHMDPKDRPMYDCDLCDYKTIQKSKMKVHKLRHASQAKLTGGIKRESEELQT